MLSLTIYQIDAFATKPFEGNPAAVVPLETWLEDDLMQKIAMENNLSETVFFVPHGDGYHIRWFTPVSEVDLCGHATLASAYVLFFELGFAEETIRFDSKSGLLLVKKVADTLEMDFPALSVASSDTLQTIMAQIFGVNPIEVYLGMDYMVVFEDEETIKKLSPDMSLLRTLDLRGAIVTAVGAECDFVSRFFAPKEGIDEDPVTGSAHSQLVPYWSERLGKTTLHAKQLSKRGGELWCVYENDRVLIRGKAVKYMQGRIEV